MSLAVEETALSDLSSASLLQSPTWARFKSDFGWNARAVRVTGGPWEGRTILVLFRLVAPGITLAYVPHAPGSPPAGTEVTAGDLKSLGASIAGILPVKPVCIRFDPLLPAGQFSEADNAAGSLRRAPVDVQPSSTVLIDLRLDPDELLAGMHKKNRYNIRVAARHTVEVTEGTGDDLAAWHDLYRATAARDRITIHPLAYYRRLFELASESEDLTVRVYLARHDGELLAGIIVAETGNQCTYLYGASSDEKRNLMPNYALQWHAMRSARESGMTSYDLFGVPHADDPAHPMHGLYRFKTGFGGTLVHRVGSWDVPTRPLAYRGYRMAEQARSYYFHRMRKKGAR